MNKTSSKAAQAAKSRFKGQIRLFEGNAADRSGVLCAESDSSDYAEVFAVMGASKVEVYDSSSRAGAWCFLVKVKGQWRFACQDKSGAQWLYYISADEVFCDPVGNDMKDEVSAFLREKDPDYFFSKHDLDAL